MTKFFLDVRVYQWDSDNDPPFDPPRGTINATTIEFANAANATTIHDRIESMLRDVKKRGIPRMTERVKPGPKNHTDPKKGKRRARP